MFISRKSYDDLRTESTKNHEESRVLAQQNAAMMTTLDWFRVRITQLEMERAQLLFNYTGVKIPTPTIHREAPGTPSNPLSQLPNFDDIGDQEALKLGIGWNEDGTIAYSK